MRLRSSLIGLILATALARATETDQFTTPKTPLHDIGPQLSRKVVEIIESDRTGRDPERILSEWAGHNPFSSRLARQARAAGFRPNPFGSIYLATFSPIPATFLAASPTVNLHGYYMGTDKLDHFFREGHQYYGLAQEKGVAAAVARGVRQEHTFLGTLSSGVYSNSDLAANFAGMKFYQNLRQMFERSADGWHLRPGIDADHLLEPFLSDHLDESLNPSRYRFSRGSIRAHIRVRCVQWAAFYSDRLHLVALSGQSFATTWFGEDYGHWLPPAEEVSIATECYTIDSRPFSGGPDSQGETR